MQDTVIFLTLWCCLIAAYFACKRILGFIEDCFYNVE